MKISMGVFFLVVGLGIALLTAPAFAGPAPSGPVALGDVSGDGRIDVVVSGGLNNSVLYVYVTDATGLGVDATESAQIALLETGWVVRAVADFNGDDHADILIENTNQGATLGLLYVMITDSTTADGAPVALDAAAGVSSALVPSGFTVAGAGDSNGDGNADVYVRDTSGLLYTYISDANGAADSNLSGSPVVVPDGWTIESIGDYNGDGRSDVLVQGPLSNGSRTVYTWTTNADGISFANSPASGSPTGIPDGWTWGGGGEFTSGTPSGDLVIQQETAGLVYVFVTNADGVTTDAGASFLSLSGLAADFSIQGIGDFNADGVSDTLLGGPNGNPGEEMLYVVLNAGVSAVTGQGPISTVPDTFTVPVNPGF